MKPNSLRFVKHSDTIVNRTAGNIAEKPMRKLLFCIQSRVRIVCSNKAWGHTPNSEKKAEY